MRVFQRARVMHLLQLAKLTAVRCVQVLDNVVKGKMLDRRRHRLARLCAQTDDLRDMQHERGDTRVGGNAVCETLRPVALIFSVS